MTDRPAPALISARQRNISMVILFFVMVFASADRFVFAVLIIPIKAEFGISDAMLGLLTGSAFAILFATLGIPVARMSDLGNRRIIVALCVAMWSGMTALCGFAGSLVQLFLFRVGVGVGEAGAVPPAHSLISDYYPPAKRAAAFSIINLGSAVGNLFVMGVGGWIAVHYGWRTLLIVIGLPGLLVAIAAHFFLAEPRVNARLVFPSLSAIASDSLASARRLFAIPAYRHLAWLFGIYGFVAYGGFLWDITLFTRSFGLPLERVAAVMGLAGVFSSLIGLLAGGMLGNYFSKQSLSWLARIPMYAMFLSFPLFLAKYLVPDFYIAAIIMAVANLLMLGFVGPFYAAVQAVTPEGDRSMAAAINVFLSNIVGLGAGPFVTGLMSDVLGNFVGVESLRYTLLIVIFLIPVAGVHGMLAARHMKVQFSAGS
jgi:MFS family permease